MFVCPHLFWFKITWFDRFFFFFPLCVHTILNPLKMLSAPESEKDANVFIS